MDWVLSQNGLSDVPQEISLKSPNQLKWSTPCKITGSDYMEKGFWALQGQRVSFNCGLHYTSSFDIISWTLDMYLFHHIWTIFIETLITSLWNYNDDHEVCMEPWYRYKQNMLLSDQYIQCSFYKMWTVWFYMHRKINSKTKIKRREKKSQWHNCRFSKENVKNLHLMTWTIQFKIL